MAIVTLLIDNPNSWFLPYAKKAAEQLKEAHHQVHNVGSHDEIPQGDILFVLSCENKISTEALEKNTHNIVIHGSSLPKGRGWSPLTWEILEGSTDHSLSAIMAIDEIDAGPIYMTKKFSTDGTELLTELHKIQGNAIVDMLVDLTAGISNIDPLPQQGEPSYYQRRTPKDSELDVSKSIAEQFDLLRVVDNDKYPAFFRHRGKRYVLKVYSEPE